MSQEMDGWSNNALKQEWSCLQMATTGSTSSSHVLSHCSGQTETTSPGTQQLHSSRRLHSQDLEDILAGSCRVRSAGAGPQQLRSMQAWFWKIYQRPGLVCHHQTHFQMILITFLKRKRTETKCIKAKLNTLDLSLLNFI